MVEIYRGNEMFHSFLKEQPIEQREKRRIAAVLCETKIEKDEVLRLIKKYCYVDDEEAVYLFQNEKFINAPCRDLEQYLLLEMGYDYEEVDLFINKFVISMLANNPELSKLTSSELYKVVKEHKKSMN